MKRFLCALTALAFVLSCSAVASAITISGTLPEATIREEYSATLIASGGEAPYSWECTGLPSGLDYSYIDGNSGRNRLYITGAPLEYGEFTVVVHCWDIVGNGWDERTTFKLKVANTAPDIVPQPSPEPDNPQPAIDPIPQNPVTTRLLSLTDQTGYVGQQFMYTITIGGGLECIIDEYSGLPEELDCTTHYGSPNNDEITIYGTPRHFGVYTVKLRITQRQNDYSDVLSVSYEGTFTLTIYDESGSIPSSSNIYGFGGNHGNSANDAWEIDSVETLVRLQTDINEGRLTSAQYFKLTNDLDISSRRDWMPIGGTVFVSMSYGQPQDILDEDPHGAHQTKPFIGNFDGNGHTIRVNISQTKQHSHADYAGLFGKVAGTIKNLSVTGNVSATLTGGGLLRAGGIAAILIEGSISNCKFDGTITATNKDGDVYAGGIVGNAGLSYYRYSLTDCKAGSVSATSVSAYGTEGNTEQNVFAGGIIGGLNGGSPAIGATGTVKGNYSRVNLTGTTEGIIGGYSVHTGQETLQLDLSDNTVADPGTSPNSGNITDPQTVDDPGTNPGGDVKPDTPVTPSSGGGGGGGCNSGFFTLILALAVMLMKRRN